MKPLALFTYPKRWMPYFGRMGIQFKRWFSHRHLRYKRLALVGLVAVAAAAAVMWWNSSQIPRVTAVPLPAAETQPPSLAPGQEVPEPDFSGAETAPAAPEKEEEKPVSEEAAVWPVSGEVIANYAFAYAPVFQDYRLHPGVDIAGNEGDPVKAMWSGRVTRIAYSSLDGYSITLEHTGGLQTVYAYLGEVRVASGQRVEAGEILGRIGKPGPGEADRGPHLHLEVHRDGVAVDPADYLGPVPVIPAS